MEIEQMEQKRISFKVAKAIKESGYPQESRWWYNEEGGEFCVSLYIPENCYAAPTYLDVWLWLWREKKKSISIICDEDARLEASWYVNAEKLLGEIGSFTVPVFPDPEESIIEAIEYLVDNNLLK